MIDDIDYGTQVYLIGIEMQKLVDDNNYNNAIKANLRNLILINTMYKCNSTDNMVIGKEMVNNYGIVDINCDNYVANEIAMFNSLFSSFMSVVYCGASVLWMCTQWFAKECNMCVYCIADDHIPTKSRAGEGSTGSSCLHTTDPPAAEQSE